MKIIKKPNNLQKIVEKLRLEGKKIAVVPTMGYLHEGHLSLVRIARKKCDVLVLTIFVNPTQFGKGEDLDRYPRDIKRDLSLAKKENVDFVFTPSVEDMYPYEYQTYVINKTISLKYEGEFRPTHFEGVTTVVAKLFNIVKNCRNNLLSLLNSFLFFWFSWFEESLSITFLNKSLYKFSNNSFNR